MRDKLTGKDFNKEESLKAKEQVENQDQLELIDSHFLFQVGLLIQQATSHENLCQCYIGWCPVW